MEARKEFPMRDDRTAWRVIDGEAVILSIEDKFIRSLNPVGTRVWELLDGTKTVDDIAEIVSSEFEVGTNQARQDILDFIEELAQKKIISMNVT